MSTFSSELQQELTCVLGSIKCDPVSIKSNPVSIKSDPVSIKSDLTSIMSHIARNQLIYQPESETYDPDTTD